jgi:cystathionine beta-lyase/cystathionine gamma-synthase
MKPATACVHAGERINPHHGAVNTPIVQSTTYRYPVAPDGGPARYIYSRYDNPTVESVEEKLAALEEADFALLFASGMGAEVAIFQSLAPGDTIAVQTDIYGGTTALLQDEIAPRGVSVVKFDPFKEAVPACDMVWVETISNPTLRVLDVARVAKEAQVHGAKLIVDATFSGPLLSKPLALGADLVLHSATKSLNGHSDVTAGVICGNSGRDQLWTRRRNLGATLDPHAASLLGRGLKTLHLRVERASSNARALAETARAEGVKVHDPKIGSTITLELPNLAAAVAFREAIKIMVPACSLGGVETLVSLPIETSHAYATDAERAAQGITDGMVRISVGIEDIADLRADLQEGLSASAGSAYL